MFSVIRVFRNYFSNTIFIHTDIITVTRTCNARNTNVKRKKHIRVTRVTRTCYANYLPKFYLMFFESFFHHIVRNNRFQCFQHGIYRTFPYEIVLNKDGHTTLCGRIDVQMYYIIFLILRQKRDVKFRNNGITAVAVNYPDQCFYTAGLVDMVPYILVLAEVHRAVRHAMAFLQYPHMFGRKASACYYLLGMTALRGEIRHELFYIDRYFEYPFPNRDACHEIYE